VEETNEGIEALEAGDEDTSKMRERVSRRKE
jgi:hypothetical protein